MQYNSSLRGGMEIIAHRGYSAFAPENTLAAIDAAAEAGADAVEWDVRVLACGTPVLFHDETLDRTSDGTGPVDGRTHQEVLDVDVGSWFSPDYTGERIPTLAAAFACAANRFARIYPEIKAYRSEDDLVAIGRIVEESGMSDRTTFISMDWSALARLRAMDDAVGIGYIVEHPRRFAAALERAAGDARAILDPDFRILLRQPELAAAAVQRGVAMATWTVNSPEDARVLADMGVRGFTTNHVTRLLEWRRNRPEPAA